MAFGKIIALGGSGGGAGTVTVGGSGSLTTNRIPKASAATALVDSSITDSGTTVSITKAAPILSLIDTTGAGKTWQLRDGTSSTGTFDIFDSTDSYVAFAAVNGETRIGSDTNQGGIGNSSRLYVFGGVNGANVDVQGDGTATDQATMELEGSDYSTNFQSIFMQYQGVNAVGTTLGFANANMGRVVFNGGVTALLYTNNSIPLIFGTNNVRRADLSASAYQFNIGVIGTGSGILGLNGSTSGTATITAPAVAGTATNPIAISNSINFPSGTVISWNNDTGISRDAAGVVDFGTGSNGSTAGSIKATSITFPTSGIAQMIAPSATFGWSSNGSGASADFRSGGYFNVGSGTKIGWSSGDGLNTAQDTSMSRVVAKVMQIGGGTADNTGWFNYGGQSRVSTQFDKTTDTALANITGLTATLIAGRNYKFRAVLHVTADAVGGQKYAVAGTCTATNIIYQVTTISNAANSIIISSKQTALGGSIGQAGSTDDFTTIEGLITVNAAGTLTVQFAQNASNGTSSVLRGSSFIVEDIP